jgi:hypothetical protein
MGGVTFTPGGTLGGGTPGGGTPEGTPGVTCPHAQQTAPVIGKHTRSHQIIVDPAQRPPRTPPEPTPEPAQTRRARERHPTDTRQTPDRLDSPSVLLCFYGILV